MTSGVAAAPTTCPACGSSLLATVSGAPVSDRSEDDSATRPVPIDQLPTRPAAEGPVAPAPAPVAPAASADDGQTRDLPASALPREPGNSRRAGGMIGGVALVIILLAIAAIAALVSNGLLPSGQSAATPTATAPAGPTATPAAIPYSVPHLYTIAYPTGWNKTERNNPPGLYSVAFVNLRGGATFNISTQQTPALVSADTADSNYLNGLTANTGTKPTNLSSPQATPLAGATWTAMSADVTIMTTAGKQYAHAVALSVNHGGYIYTIVRLVPVTSPTAAQSAFDTAEQASFQPMLASFTFAS